jgi:hypothetical protein
MSKTRSILITTATILSIMVVVGIAQYLVSRDGTISMGALVGVSVPTGLLLGQSLAKKK